MIVMNNSVYRELDDILRLIETEAKEVKEKNERVITDIRSLRTTLKLERMGLSTEDLPF